MQIETQNLGQPHTQKRRPEKHFKAILKVIFRPSPSYETPSGSQKDLKNFFFKLQYVVSLMVLEVTLR